MVSDIGTHWLDLTTWITGRKVTELCADLATVVPVRQRPRGRVETFQKRGDAAFDEIQITNDDYASVLLHFEGSIRGVMTVSQVSAGRKCNLWFEMDGSEGSLAWNAESPNTLWIGRRNEANQSMIKDPALMSPEARGYAAYPGGHAEGYPDTFAAALQGFLRLHRSRRFQSSPYLPHLRDRPRGTDSLRCHRRQRPRTALDAGSLQVELLPITKKSGPSGPLFS